MTIVKLRLEKINETTIAHPVIEILKIMELELKCLCRIRDENDVYERLDFVSWPDLMDEIIREIYVEVIKPSAEEKEEIE